MAHWTLAFDRSRPFGPLKDNGTCTVGLKTVSFDARASTGYTHGMQLIPLAPQPKLHHVFSLKVTGLQQEYGWNAVAVVMDKHDGNPVSDNMFTSEKQARPAPHDLWIYSQFTCPWAKTLLTLMVSPNNAAVEVWVEQILETRQEAVGDDEGSSSKKRKTSDAEVRNDKAMPYLPAKDTDMWTDLGDGLKHRSFDGGFMQKKMPNIGVLMCGALGNRVEISPASPRVLKATKLDHASLVVYS